MKRYGDVVAVAGIDLTVHTGECFGLLGPNGAGKTTTVEILEGLTDPDAGDIEVLGRRWRAGNDRALRERLGVQLQESQLAEKLTVTETVRLFRSFYRTGRQVDDVISTIGLQEKRRARVGKLSGGQKQRLALGCALVGDPELLFLDEPTTGLDPQARLNVWDTVDEFRGRGGSVLLTTHYMDEASRLCDRVAIMDNGRLIAEGAPPDLVASLGGEQIVEFRANGDVDRAALARLPGVRSVDRNAGSYMLSVEEVGAALPALLAELDRRGIRMDGLEIRRASLEDVFVHLTGRELRDE